MADQSQKFEQIKRDPASEVQKINLGWKGYVPGYKNRWVERTNEQIRQSAERIDRSTRDTTVARLPGGPIERPGGFRNITGETDSNLSAGEEGLTVQRAAQEEVAQQIAAEEQEFLEAEDQMADFALGQEVAQAEQKVNELNDRIDYFKHPSVMKYLLLLLPLALLVDILDIIAYFMAATVLGVSITILLLFVSIFLNCVIIFLFWFTDSGIKEAKGYPAKANFFVADNLARIKEIRILRQGRSELKVAQATQNVEEIAKAQRAIRAAKTTARTARVARLAKSTVGSPIVRIGVGGALNAAPGLGLIPIMSIALFLSYLSERKIYRQAREAAEQAKQEILVSMAEVV